MNAYDWEAMIGEAFMQGEFARARRYGLEYALWRDQKLTPSETIAALSGAIGQ